MRNETIGNNVLRFAMASQIGSVPRKSAENAVFLQYLRGWIQMNPAYSNEEGKLNCINAVVITHKKELKIHLFFYLFFPVFACVYDIDIFRIL